MNLYWFYVLLGSISEVAWVSGLKHAASSVEWLLTAGAVSFSFYLLIKVSDKLPVGTVYIVFTGLGTAGTVASEMLLYGEPLQPLKLLLIAILLSGVIGLKWITAPRAVGKEQTKPTRSMKGACV